MATATILGCPQSYTCLVSNRGGKPWVGRLENVTSITWDRKLNAMGEATVTMAANQASAACCQLMALLSRDVSQRAYELHIFRDTTEVWCGPIQTLTETRGPTNQAFTMTARDVLSYLDTHYLQAGYNITADVVDLAMRVIGADLVSDDPALLAHLVATQAGVSVTRAAARASASVLSEMTALIQSGLRFTTATRTVYLGGLRGTPFGVPFRLSVEQIAGDVSLAHDGSSYFNTVYGRSGSAGAQVPAGAIPPDDPQMVTVGGPEPGWRGRVEGAVSAANGSNGQSGVVAAAQAAYFNARRPRVLRVADGSQIAATATVSVQQLVPGTVVKIAGAQKFCTWVAEDLQLVRVTGSYANDGEKIGVSLGPVG